MEIDFKSKFLNCEFDNILINKNNPLINSYDIYIQYKQKYIINTRKNFDLYQQLIKEYTNLKNMQYQTPYKNVVIYTFIPDEKLDELSFKIINLIKEQQTNFDNFMHYINYLNDNIDNYIVNENSKSKNTIRRNKNIFTRLLEGGTKAKIKRRTPTT